MKLIVVAAALASFLWHSSGSKVVKKRTKTSGNKYTIPGGDGSGACEINKGAWNVNDGKTYGHLVSGKVTPHPGWNGLSDFLTQADGSSPTMAAQCDKDPSCLGYMVGCVKTSNCANSNDKVASLQSGNSKARCCTDGFGLLLVGNNPGAASGAQITGKNAFKDYRCFKKEAAAVSATGDPHLVNAQGKKFDVHDGKHVLVRYPRDAPDSEVLLRVEGDAAIMGGETSCYNVYFQAAKLSGKWIGEDILFQTSDAPMGKKEFLFGVGGQFRSWSALAKEAANLTFSGSEPLKVSIGHQEASPDMPGGDKIELSIGHTNPMLMDVWASRGSNELTDQNDIQFLNLQIKHLPENSGGLLGSDAYIKPAAAKCGLTQQETGPISSLKDLVFLQQVVPIRAKWILSAEE